MSGRLSNNVTLPLIKKCLVVSWKNKGEKKTRKRESCPIDADS